MSYSTFRLGANDATKEPMFLGNSVNVSRYDIQKYREFEKLIEKQLSFFWRPEEVDISQDRIDYMTKLADHERHIFTSNLRYQTLLDSVQGRSPNVTRCCRWLPSRSLKRGLKPGPSPRPFTAAATPISFEAWLMIQARFSTAS
jgi:hypothetical protein